MSTNNSDHTQPQIDLTSYIPEVYQSEVSQTIFDVAFNRHLTKDDTQSVSGIIGQPNPQALINRQLVEPTPFRQAYQLAPVMHTKIGTVDTNLSFKSMEHQLEMAGIDMNRYPLWGNTLHFNWAPPVNIDMLVNYQDYYWAPQVVGKPPQYLTIENNCNKVQGRVASYQQLLVQYDPTYPVTSINVANNAFIVSAKLDVLFVAGFVFFTKNSTNVNLQNKYWTVSSSTYDFLTDQTTIYVVEPIAIHSSTPPVSPIVDQWWYDTTTHVLYAWSGSTWIVASSSQLVDISITELLTVYQIEANCVCNQTLGWDVAQWDDNQVGRVAQWDDNQVGRVVWNTSLLASISSSTPMVLPIFTASISGITLTITAVASGTLLANQTITGTGVTVGTYIVNQLSGAIGGAGTYTVSVSQTVASELMTTLYDLWYNTSLNTLNQWNGGTWVTVVSNFSTILSATTGFNPWDASTDPKCAPQQMNQWVVQNQWIHKSEVQSFAGVKKATMPILEYNSRLEMNEWAQDLRSWKYRRDTSFAFESTTKTPPRFELEPIKGQVATLVSGSWHIYLFDKTRTINRDIDYTTTFVPGIRFKVVDNGTVTGIYTVASSEYREVTLTEVLSHPTQLDVGYLVTIIRVVESTYIPPVNPISWIEPTVTSQGDLWKGYHAHWVLDTALSSTIAAAPQSWDVPRRRSSNQTIPPASTVDGFLYVGESHQELTVTVPGVTTILLNSALMFGSVSTPFATPGSGTLRVYKNGIRQYTSYTELTALGAPNVTVVGFTGHTTGYQIPYVTGIQFTVALNVTDVVRIEVGTAAFSDMGMIAVPTRTIEHEIAFVAAVNGAYYNVPLTGGAGTGAAATISVAGGVVTTVVIVNGGSGYNVTDTLSALTSNIGGTGSGFTVSITTISYGIITALGTIVGGTNYTTIQQPVYTTLAQYRHVEQVKTGINQYPLFNIYNTITGNILDASPVFSFTEDSSYPINLALTRRIVASSDGKEYQFTQHLLDTDDHLLYGYRNTSSLADSIFPKPQKLWYNPTTQSIKAWDGKAWTSHMTWYDPTPGTMLIRVPTIRTTDPVITATTYPFDLWYNTITNIMWIKSSTVWQMGNIPVVVGADPTLQTVWKHGLHNEQFVPQYVDSHRAPTTVGSPDGDWQMPDQWIFNPEHNNKSTVLMSELSTHFGAILAQQPASPGLQSGGVFALTQDEINYGLGGTIKEHNDSFDTLISAFNINNTTPQGVLEFAKREYASNLLFLQEIYEEQIVSLLSRPTQANIANLSAYVADSVIIIYQQNQYMTEVYGGTSAYDPITKLGVQHWISSSPMFGFSAKHAPHLNVGDTFVELYHHDGHRSQVVLPSSEADLFARSIISSPDPRSGYGKLGKTSSSLAPATAAAFATELSTGDVLPGTFWYRTGSGLPILYRLEAYAVQNVAPAFYLNGVELPNGTMYYNTVDKATYRKQGLSWVLITTLGAGTITPLWVAIDFQKLLAEVYLEVESRLYEATPDYNTSKFEYELTGIPVQATPPTGVATGSYWYNTATNVLSRLVGTVWNPITLGTTTPLVFAAPPAQQAAEQAAYNAYQHERFIAFVVERNIVAPLVNTNYSLTDPFTWNYISSVMLIPPRTGTVPPPASSWQEVYTRWYGTPYPHLEPWVLQKFTNKPTWWDTQYKDSTNVRRWTAAMWSDILAGLTPYGTPDTPAPTYAYVSVNIGSTSTVGGYGPDQLLPPYYASGAGNISSLYTSYNQIISPAADYAFGDVGPGEWMWSTSIQRVYDTLITAFKMQPVRFMHYAFGPQYTIVDGLQVETTFGSVYAHQTALFHGDLYNTNQVYTSRGLNQWYVNYNRYTGFDTNDHFRQLWSNWTPRLAYQVGGIVDTGTFTVTNNYFDVNNQDYAISLVNTGTIKDVWVDAFEVSVLSMPPALSQYNSQGAWKLELSTLTSVPRTLTCYGAKIYTCIPSVSTDEIHVLRFNILSASSLYQQIVVAGDQTTKFKNSSPIYITSLTNTGNFTVVGSRYQPSTTSTLLSLAQPIFDAGAEGYLELRGTIVSWETGDRVVVSSTKLVPAPLLADTSYYVIKTGVNTYRLAESQQDAYANLFVDITSVGTGLVTIAEVASTFYVYGGTGGSKELWYHYVLDTNDIFTLTPPYAFMSVQTLINIVDGYSAHQQTQGAMYGVGEGDDFDPTTGRLVDWQLETERFIDWAYRLRNSRITISDKYEATVAVTTQNLSFADMVPSWTTGTQVIVNTTGTLPSPLLPNTPYYYQQTATPGVFQLAVTSIVTGPSSIITFTTSGVGSLFISLYNANSVFPSFEINPTRNNIWIDTPQGVLANVVDGPYSDIQAQQTIFDQYGRPLRADKLMVYREDKRSHLVMRPAVSNDVDITSGADPYNYIHFGGAHLFIEGFEHFVVFNNTTVGGNLVYNPFLGLYSTRFDVNFYEKKDYSLRPTLGGFYLNDGQFSRNIEGTASDMKELYDLQAMSESSNTTQHARALIGYVGRSKYLDLINIGLKSQFIFYRGMIRAKGSVNSITAYINSRRFVDAQVDECWAWKVAEFGDIRARMYPEIKLFAADGLVNDIRLEFLANSELSTDPDVVEAVSKGFQLVSFSDATRWNNFPEQKSNILTPLFLDAEVTSAAIIYSGETEPTPQQVYDGNLQYWFDSTNNLAYEWDTTVTPATWTLIPGKILRNNSGSSVYFKHDTICDDARVYRHNINPVAPTDFTDVSTTVFIRGTGLNQYTRINAEVVRIPAASFVGIMIIFSINSSQKKTSPAHLVDTQSHVVVQSVPLWHPAKGYHYPIAAHNVDVQQSIDPARYQVSLSTPSTNAWNQIEVGTTWLDTNVLGYLPYYDSLIYPDINDRLYAWGNLAPWSSIKVYKWTKSSVPPSGYAASVLADVNNSTIPQNNKTTGTVRTTVFRRSRPGSYPAVWGSWERHDLIRDKLHAVLDVSVGTHTTLPLANSLWRNGDFADVYQNGVLFASSATVSGGVVTLPTITIAEKDIIDVVRPIHVVTPAEAAFDPLASTGPDSIVTVQWKQDYEYTSTITTTGSTTTGVVATTNYYFWVEGSTNSVAGDSTSLSAYETAQQLKTIPSPYFVVQDPKDDPTMTEAFGYGLIEYGSTFAAGTTAEQFFIVPVLYRQAILRNIASYINADNRYVIRFLRDLTLRDNLRANGLNMNLKDKHEEWQVFREKQPDAVPLLLWNKLVEALQGHTLTDSTIRVPSLERELYDLAYNTDTQYGLEVDQAFVNKTTALMSIQAYLQDPTNNFYPADMDSFFSRNNFDTPTAIYAAMLEIYNTFPVAHVNAIWFSTLHDALTTKAKYKDLMKTSWVVLHGVRVLEVGGKFDD